MRHSIEILDPFGLDAEVVQCLALVGKAEGLHEQWNRRFVLDTLLIAPGLANCELEKYRFGMTT